MRISRCGSGAFHGFRVIEFQSPELKWNATDQALQIAQNRVRDFNTVSDHDYVASISLSEFASLMQIMADAAMASPRAFETGLAGTTKALAEMHAVSAGLVQPPGVEPEG